LQHLSSALSKAARLLSLVLFSAARPAVTVVSICTLALSSQSEGDLLAARYRGGADWLREHGGDSVVLNADWDSFPALRFYGGGIRLVHGLDPVFVSAYDKAAAIKKANEGDTTSRGLVAAFEAKYAICRRRTPLAATGTASGWKVAYQNSWVLIFEVDG
jgi:hypothetical protein